MGFLGIGTGEILLILILALIILGPGKLTEFARKMGKTVRAIRKATNDLTTSVTRELDVTQNNPPTPQSTEEKSETPSVVTKANVPSKDDQPTKPGGAPAAK